VPITADLNLTGAHFGAAPFDYSHALETSQLCESIGAFLGLTGDELWACRAAGMFHDLGRNIEVPLGGGVLDRKNGGKVSLWTERAPDHARVSADLAEIALQKDVNFMATHLDQRVCRVIGQHNIHGPTPTDPIAKALYDADILEAARFGHYYGQDIGLFEKFLHGRYSRLCTEWARDPRVKERWRRTRNGSQAPGKAFQNSGVDGRSASEIAQTITSRRA
jgi:HD superfamily phosphohydrolase YqeK